MLMHIPIKMHEQWQSINDALQEIVDHLMYPKYPPINLIANMYINEKEKKTNRIPINSLMFNNVYIYSI